MTATSMHTSSRQRRGFTLVELMIVIGIIMMLIAISAPLLTTMAQRRSIEGSVEIAKIEFMQLRERAATTGMPVVLVVEHWTDPIRFMSWSPIYDETAERWIWMLVSVARMPEGIWAHDSWLDDVNDMSESTELPTGIDFQDAITTLLLQDYAQDGYYSFPSPPEEETGEEEFDGMELRRERSRCYALVFTPEGSLHMIGRPNVPITDFHLPGDPDGDLIFTNGRTIIYMVINPATGRIEWKQEPYVSSN